MHLGIIFNESTVNQKLVDTSSIIAHNFDELTKKQPHNDEEIWHWYFQQFIWILSAAHVSLFDANPGTLRCRVINAKLKMHLNRSVSN